MDFKQKKKDLSAKIIANGFPNKEVVLTLDEFFEGNNDSGSIGVNIYPNQPPPEAFYETFKKIKQSGKIEDIMIRVSDIEETDWFYTDTVYFIGSASLEEIKEMTKDLHPDEIYQGWMYGLPINIPPALMERNAYSLWWD